VAQPDFHVLLTRRNFHCHVRGQKGSLPISPAPSVPTTTNASPIPLLFPSYEGLARQPMAIRIDEAEESLAKAPRHHSGARCLAKYSRPLKIAAVSFVVLAVLGFAAFLVLPGVTYRKEVGIRDLLANASMYNGKLVKTRGYIARNIGAFYGETYDLYTSDPTNLYFAANPSVALGGNSSDLEAYTSFTYDGRTFEAMPGRVGLVIVEGTFHDQGPVVDAPRYYIDVSKVYPSS